MPAAKNGGDAFEVARRNGRSETDVRGQCLGETGIGDDRDRERPGGIDDRLRGVGPAAADHDGNPGFPAHVAQARGGLAAFDDQRRPRDAEAGLRCGFLPMALVGAADLRAALLILELALGFRLRHAHVAQEYPALDQEVGKSGGEKDADRRSEQNFVRLPNTNPMPVTPHTEGAPAYPTCQGARRGEHSRAGAP